MCHRTGAVSSVNEKGCSPSSVKACDVRILCDMLQRAGTLEKFHVLTWTLVHVDWFVSVAVKMEKGSRGDWPTGGVSQVTVGVGRKGFP